MLGTSVLGKLLGFGNKVVIRSLSFGLGQLQLLIKRIDFELKKRFNNFNAAVGESYLCRCLC